ncbi:MAG: hypothetical protein AB1486_28945 [Planctomycetota bacterium]
MLKQILIVVAVVVTAAAVFGGSIFLFRSLKIQRGAGPLAMKAGLGLGDRSEPGGQARGTQPSPPEKTESEKIEEIASSMWRLPSPLGFDQLADLTRELEQERARLQEEWARVKAEKTDIARERTDLEEREKIVEASIRELESLNEESMRAEEADRRRAALMRESQDRLVSQLAKDFEERSIKAEDVAGILSEIDEALALRVLRQLSTKTRSKIFSAMEKKDAARWIGRLQELDILEGMSDGGTGKQ